MDTHVPGQAAPIVERFRCCHCGGTGLDSCGDTCPHCDGHGNTR